MKIAIIGAGNMGGAVARGLAACRETLNADIWVSNPSVSKLDAIKCQYPFVSTTQSNDVAIRGAQVVIMAVKPWKLAEVAGALEKSAFNSCEALVSMAGGVALNDIRDIFDMYASSGRPYYYVIPNTAASVGQSMTFIASSHPDSETNELVKQIFDCVGKSMVVEPRFMNAGMAVASCGIAFVMRFVRAMEEGGVELGLYPAWAREAAIQTMRGAADLLEAGGNHPEQEVDKVTTPGGLTIRGLNAMEEAGLSGAIIKGLRACIR